MSKRNKLFKGFSRSIGSNVAKRDDCMAVINGIKGKAPHHKPFSYSQHDIDAQLKLLGMYYTAVIEQLRDKLHMNCTGESDERVKELSSKFEKNLTRINKQANESARLCLKAYMKREQHKIVHHPHQGKRECLRRMKQIVGGYHHGVSVVHVNGESS